MIADERLVAKLVEIGKQEIEKMNNGVINYEIITELSETNAMILSNKKDFLKKKIFKKKIKKMKFKLLYYDVNFADRRLLEKILYIPNGINFREIEYKYGITEKMSIFILAVLHELSHIFDMISDVKEHKFLKRTNMNDLEYVTYIYSLNMPKTREEQIKKYKDLERERIADELSIKLFKENLEKLSIFIKQLT